MKRVCFKINYVKKIVIILLSILVYSCDFHKVYQPINTISVIESKKTGAFELEYYPKEVFINDSIYFTIKEAWCEKVIYSDYEKDENGKVIPDYWRDVYHIVFITDTIFANKCKKEYDNRNWRFLRGGIDYFSPANSLFKIRSNNKKINLQDSVKIELEYSIPSDNPNTPYPYQRKPLGSFYLVKKPNNLN